MTERTLCFLGCGNLCTPILKCLIKAPDTSNYEARFTKYIACVRSESSGQRLKDQFTSFTASGKLTISLGDNVNAIKSSDVIILGVDPSQVISTMNQEGLQEAWKDKLLISVVAGLSRKRLIQLTGGHAKVLRTLPNVAAQVSQSLTAIEDPGPDFPEGDMAIAVAIFSAVGKAVHVSPEQMAATTAVGGSTPAFWAIICDAFIDAAVAVGLPRHIAQAQIYQSMRGTAEMLQSGIQPGELRDMGTSPEGCTIGGIMVLEEGGVRGHLGKALREAVTIARLMGGLDGRCMLTILGSYETSECLLALCAIEDGWADSGEFQTVGTMERIEDR